MASREHTVCSETQPANSGQVPLDRQSATGQIVYVKGDDELIPSDGGNTVCREQMVVHCKQNLGQLVERLHTRLKCLQEGIGAMRELVGYVNVEGHNENSSDEGSGDDGETAITREENDDTCKIVMWPELEQALRLRRPPENIVIGSEEGDSSDDSDEESCDFEEKAYTTKDDYRAGKLRMLLDFEQHLHLLQVSENAVGLRNEITSRLEQCWGGKLSADSTCRLQMMWESADSVWLLREWQSDSLLVLQRVRNIMEQIYPTAAQQHAIVDCSQLIAMFQERLKQWQHHADNLKQLHRDLSDMLRCWPQQHTQQTMSKSQLHKQRTRSTGDIDKIAIPPSSLSQQDTAPIRRVNSQSHICYDHYRAVFSVAVEAVFPQCAIFRQTDEEVEMNREVLAMLQDGRAYDGEVAGSDEWVTSLRDGSVYGGDVVHSMVMGRTLIAGSQAEGLAIEEGWGHPQADTDTMLLYGGPLGVHVPQGRNLPGHASLRYRAEGCPAAYCKIEVTNVQTLMGVEMTDVHPYIGLADSKPMDVGFIKRSNGIDWLHTNNMLRWIQRGSDNLSGPAAQIHNGLLEYIPALVCSDAHPDLEQSYVQRPRHGWPSPQQLELTKQLRMLLVLTGHKQSHPDEILLQARLSWSTPEIVLIHDLPENIKQVYIAVKYAFKCLMKKSRDPNVAGDGRSNVGSYHLKTVFLRHLEKRPPTMVRSQLDFMIGLLYDIDGYLKQSNLPHYFLPECNLLETVGPEERRIARDVIQQIIFDPQRAILACPTYPEDIYGEVPSDALVAAFHRVSSNRTCMRSQEDLLRLLSHLDEKREVWYRSHQMELFVSGRAGLKGLVDMLRECII